MIVRAVALTALVAVALTLGFAAGLGVITVLSAVLPPFREELDDDTIREFVPVALAYVTWAATSVAILMTGWRRLIRSR